MLLAEGFICFCVQARQFFLTVDMCLLMLMHISVVWGAAWGVHNCCVNSKKICLPIQVTLFATEEGYVDAGQSEEKNEPTSCNKELMNAVCQL